MDFEVFEYNGHSFSVFEDLDYFIVVVNDETYLLDSMADVREFIQYYFDETNDKSSYIN